MNYWLVTCIGLSLVFLLFALIFTLMKGKATLLISGFNSKSKEERHLYDLEKMSLDYRNDFLLWSSILGVGALISYFVWQDFAIVSIIGWLIVFCKDIHLDEEKAFGKYKR